MLKRDGRGFTEGTVTNNQGKLPGEEYRGLDLVLSLSPPLRARGDAKGPPSTAPGESTRWREGSPTNMCKPPAYRFFRARTYCTSIGRRGFGEWGRGRGFVCVHGSERLEPASETRDPIDEISRLSDVQSCI